MKRVLIALLILTFSLSIFGCSRNDFETYRKACIKTNEISKGQMSFEMKSEGEFNTDGLTTEETKKLNYFKKVEAKADMTFNWNEKKLISRSYYNFGGIGFDSILYVDGEKAYIRMPMTGKYFILQELEEYEKKNKEDAFYWSQDTIDSINEEWINMLRKEDVLKGENTILTTPDGEVKTTHFTITLTEGQLKELLGKSIDIIAEDENIRKAIEEGMKSNKENTDIKSFSQIISELKKLINNCSIENFNYDAFIDIDGYITQENIELDIKFNSFEPNTLEKQHIEIQINNWNIEKEQKFDFPKLTEENTLDEEDIEQGIPFMFEDIFNTSEKEE